MIKKEEAERKRRKGRGGKEEAERIRI